MVVAIARLTLIIHDNNSLKGKRKVVKSLIEKVRHRFEASVAEVRITTSGKRPKSGGLW